MLIFLKELIQLHTLLSKNSWLLNIL